MGLDMYLTKKNYVGAEYEHRNVTGKIDIKIDGKKLPINFKKVSYIEERAGYWRKANQIHKWFVDNVQDGEDDCKEYYVAAEKLEELLTICKDIKEKCGLMDGVVQNGYTFNEHGKQPIMEDGKMMTNQEYAHEKLPTTSGFFFGGTDYDQYYMQDIDDTIEILEDCLKDTGGEYYYSSSW